MFRNIPDNQLRVLKIVTAVVTAFVWFVAVSMAWAYDLDLTVQFLVGFVLAPMVGLAIPFFILLSPDGWKFLEKHKWTPLDSTVVVLLYCIFYQFMPGTFLASAQQAPYGHIALAMMLLVFSFSGTVAGKAYFRDRRFRRVAVSGIMLTAFWAYVDLSAKVHLFDVVIQCKDGLDNDGDGLVDAEDPACQKNGEWWKNGTLEDLENPRVILHTPGFTKTKYFELFDGTPFLFENGIMGHGASWGSAEAATGANVPDSTEPGLVEGETNLYWMWAGTTEPMQRVIMGDQYRVVIEGGSPPYEIDWATEEEGVWHPIQFDGNVGWFSVEKSGKLRARTRSGRKLVRFTKAGPKQAAQMRADQASGGLRPISGAAVPMLTAEELEKALGEDGVGNQQALIEAVKRVRADQAQIKAAGQLVPPLSSRCEGTKVCESGFVSLGIEIKKGQMVVLETSAPTTLAVRIGDKIVGEKETTGLASGGFGGTIAAGALPSGPIAVANYSEEDIRVRIR